MDHTSWQDVVGHKCVICGKCATHIYKKHYLCCTCHGGRIIKEDTAQRMHEQLTQARIKVGDKWIIKVEKKKGVYVLTEDVKESFVSNMAHVKILIRFLKEKYPDAKINKVRKSNNANISSHTTEC